MLKESQVLERIATAVDDLDCDGLAELHNHLTIYPAIEGDDIEPTEGWHLIPKEGAH